MLGRETDTPGVEIETLGTVTETPGTLTETPGTLTETPGMVTVGRFGTLGSVTGGSVGGAGGAGAFSAGDGVGLGAGAGAGGSGGEPFVAGAVGEAVTAAGSRVPPPPPAEVSGALAFGPLDSGVLIGAGAEMCTVLRVCPRPG
jgi:hypothetical protein